MIGLSTDDVSTVCQTFYDLAYPEGEETIPASRQAFLHLPENRDFHEYQAEAKFSPGCFQTIRKEDVIRGYVLRLGSSHYPHLKLKIHQVFEHGQPLWIYSVDTHDAFSSTEFRPPPDHPDAAAWMQLQATNAALKEKIEAVWERQGFLTFNGLLRSELNEPPRYGA